MQSARSSTSSSAGFERPKVNQRATITLLGAGAFGLAWSLTTTAAYLPALLGKFTTSTTLVGLILAAEGLFAITLPLVIGPWSDNFHTPLGRRRPFMLAALGPLVFCLALLAFMPSLWTMALLLFAFFFAYYVYEPPYRGLYPDLVHPPSFGRAQGVQHVFRGAALGGALVGGGLLLDLWGPAPFLVAAAVVGLACAVPIVFLREDGGHGRVFEGVAAYVNHSWRVLRRNPDVARWLVANTAWEGTFSGARTFAVLYITVGLAQPISTSTTVLGAVALGYVTAAIAAGRLGERFGLARTILVASVVYGLGLFGGGFAVSWQTWYLLVVIPVAMAGGLVMTLAWSLLFTLMPAEDRGAVSGLATTSKGVGLVIGPLAAGAAIELLRGPLAPTLGYQALWPVLGLPIIAVLPFVAELARRERTLPA